MMRLLRAKYRGACKSCGAEIQVGQGCVFFPRDGKGQKVGCLGCFGSEYIKAQQAEIDALEAAADAENMDESFGSGSAGLYSSDYGRA